MNQLRYGLRVARDAANWSIRLYFNKFWPIVGVSMIPTVQRFWLVGQTESPSTALTVAGEILAQGSRVLLVWLLLRYVFTGHPALATLTVQQRWDRFTTFVDRHTGAFVTQFGVLALAFLAFDRLPDLLMTALVPADDLPLITAIVVAAKNPTVIALTLVWMCGAAGVMALRTIEADSPKVTTPPR